MIEYYLPIKHVHIFTVMFSVLLFFVRGVLVLAERPAVGNHWTLRYLSYTNDTVLLTAAVMLVSILPGAVFANGWLWVKLALLIVYVALGIMALKRAHTKRAKAIYFLSALVVFAYMFTVARAHHPLGIFQAF